MAIRNFLFGGAAISSAATNLGLLALRLVFGLSLALAHGWGKLPPSEKFISGVGEMGFPLPVLFAWLAALAEFAGGGLLAIGLLTRPAAIFVGFNMAVAFFIRHADDTFRTKELALLYLTFAVVMLIVGAGKYSVDGRLGRKG